MTLRDPFNPKDGEFAKNIRSIVGDDLTELRESMKEFGWIKEFPALIDEHDVTLVGHRRLKVAKELKIEPVIKRLTLGKGDAADAERLRLAIVSNIGFKAMTPADRKRIAEYLYGSLEWSQRRIAAALNVSQATISWDLLPVNKPHSGKSGRPKGRPDRPNRQEQSRTERQNRIDARNEKIVAFADKGLTANQIAGEVNLVERNVHQILEHERIRREAVAEPEIDPSTLSISAQQKFEAALRQHQRKLDAAFEQRVLDECRKRIEQTILPSYDESYAHYQDVIKARKGVMDRNTYRKIISCLHPDRVSDSSLKKRYEEAFRLFGELEKRLLNEKESPTPGIRMPRTYEELMALKQKVSEARKQSRQAVRPRGNGAA